MLSREEIRDVMGDRNIAEVSRQSGVAYHKLRKLLTEPGHDPKYSTLKAISNYLVDDGATECPFCHDGDR